MLCLAEIAGFDTVNLHAIGHSRSPSSGDFGRTETPNRVCIHALGESPAWQPIPRLPGGIGNITRSSGILPLLGG